LKCHTLKNEVKQIFWSYGISEWKLIKQVPTEQLLCQLLISDYNIEIADSEQRLTVSLFDYLTANNGVMPTDYNIVDYGYPYLLV
jgi:hypothetical protein